MFPVLFQFPDFLPLLGGKSLHTYGLMVALGFLFGMIYVRRESRRVGLNEDQVMDLFFYLAVAGLVGSRILYVMVSVDDFWSDPMVFFRVWEGGLVFQGGVIGSLLVAVFYIRKHKLPFYLCADTFVPALSLGHALGRLGCFFAGCCYGKQCGLYDAFCLVFPHNPDTVAPPGIPLMPTQLMESFGEFMLFGFLIFYRWRKPFDGAVFLMYLMTYSVLRSIVEVFRGDTVRGFVIEPYLSNGQFISLIAFLASLFLWVYLKNTNKSEV